MQECIMEIYFHQQNVNNVYLPNKKRDIEFRGRESVLVKRVGESADKFVRRPVAEKSATGLHGLENKNIFSAIRQYGRDYVHNIQHTVEHKIVFAKIADEVLGKKYKRSLARGVDMKKIQNLLTYYKDVTTHDLDKLVLYVLGFPRDYVSKVHRAHSEHHWESGKKPNLRTMLCDNIASSPEFKPEKKLSLRDYYFSSPELQSVEGFGDILEKYDFGENLDFEKLKHEQKHSGATNVLSHLAKVIPFIIANII